MTPNSFVTQPFVSMIGSIKYSEKVLRKETQYKVLEKFIKTPEVYGNHPLGKVGLFSQLIGLSRSVKGQGLIGNKLNAALDLAIEILPPKLSERYMYENKNEAYLSIDRIAKWVTKAHSDRPPQNLIDSLSQACDEVDLLLNDIQEN